jgi:hypothetical protein
MEVDLALQGYSVEPAGTPGVFRIHRPIVKGGGIYLVNAALDTCNCASRVRCRHRNGLRALLFATAALLEDVGEVEAAALLLKAWSEAIVYRKALNPHTQRREQPVYAQ